MKYLICLLLENEPGALSRVVGLFSQRNFNIEALNVAPTDNHEISRITITTLGDKSTVEQITKNLNKLINVVRVVNITNTPHNKYELMLAKIKALTNDARSELKRTIDIFHGSIVDTTANSYTAMISGEPEKLDAFLDAINATSILEIVRSGAIAASRGDKTLNIREARN